MTLRYTSTTLLDSHVIKKELLPVSSQWNYSVTTSWEDFLLIMWAWHCPGTSRSQSAGKVYGLFSCNSLIYRRTLTKDAPCWFTVKTHITIIPTRLLWGVKRSQETKPAVFRTMSLMFPNMRHLDAYMELIEDDLYLFLERPLSESTPIMPPCD